MKPEWKEVGAVQGVPYGTYGKIFWCKGCGCLKIEQLGSQARYLVPRREKERRKNKGMTNARPNQTL
jgi:hypothetical protein